MAKQITPEFLYRSFLQGNCSPEELQALYRYFGTADETALRALIEVELSAPEETAATAGEERKLAALKEQIDARIRLAETGRVRRLWPRIAAAASVLVVLGVGAYFLTRPKPVMVADVQPFTGKVILHTGHSRIALEKTAKGQLAANVQKTSADGIVYTASKETIYDTLEVTSGGRPGHIFLADGSEVTLNVASKLRYPENFRAGASDIELIEGEAYFEIKHDLAQPITIKAKDQVINDMGTEFNVNTYNNEPDSRTTLVEGKIAVNDRNIKPGFQAIITPTSLIIAKANLRQVTAWKDGYFRFSGENIQAVMRELARWYNIEVAYQGKPTDVGFILKISRARPISEVLKALERTSNKVHFKIEGRRITVLSKT